MNRHSLIGLLVCFMSACAAAPARPPAVTDAVPSATSGTSRAIPVTSNTLAPFPAGTAMVVFYRPPKLAGIAVSFTVREGTKEFGTLWSGKYFTRHVPPGKHTFVVHTESTGQLTIDADEGETYYIEVEAGMGIMLVHPHLKPSDKAAFDAAKDTLTEVQPTTG